MEERLLRPGEVAAVFGIDIKTVRRWSKRGILTPIRPNPQGWIWYRESQVRELLDAKDN